MSDRPAYFERIREESATLWKTLESDRTLAAPWRQLFEQVQSPRHVISELLQNADDARATDASVFIDDGVFVFEHNGEDFTEENFESLCRFGYSSKRALHTIGFRGIGFKSTFALGDPVELLTPSLRVAFQEERFTHPQWIDRSGIPERTRVQVPIKDEFRLKEVEENFAEWVASSLSLLFFRNIRRLSIGNQDLRWETLAPGPVPDSEWVGLQGGSSTRYLLIRSREEDFPAEALDEIRRVRALGAEDNTIFPSCQIEVVLGGEGQLFVVLPTGVETGLPFSCNAPFIQDPSRSKIKDPATSPTNRWLLERAGRLAAEAMLSWLENPGLSLADRAYAYALLPELGASHSSLGRSCADAVIDAFDRSVQGKAILLTTEGKLVPAKASVFLPPELLKVWGVEQSSALLDGQRRPPLATEVSARHRKTLQRRTFLDQVDAESVLNTLRSKHAPKPGSWNQLLGLWSYLTPHLLKHRWSPHDYVKKVNMFPVQGRESLWSAAEIVRLGRRKVLHSEQDLEFLNSYLAILDPEWPRFLNGEHETALPQQDSATAEALDHAQAILRESGMAEASDTNAIIDQVAGKLFASAEIDVAAAVQIAQIAAKQNATVGDKFRYLTLDEKPKPADSVVYGQSGDVEELIPPALRPKMLMHPGYSRSFTSCSAADWEKWVGSGRAKLAAFIPLSRSQRWISGREKVEAEALRRGLHDRPNYHFVTSDFLLDDWDFDDSYWRYWAHCAENDDHYWADITVRILSQTETYWSKSERAAIRQVATTRNTRSITDTPLLPSWILKLREKPCLPDTHGVPQYPADLLLRTAETEAFHDIEPFVKASLDREETRPLLQLLGVRAEPANPDRIIAVLHGLARLSKPPTSQIEQWYRRLDQIAKTCSTENLDIIRRAFADNKLILTHEGDFETSSAVYQRVDDDDVPNAALISPSVKNLTLWGRIGVAERPTSELAIKWINTLPPRQVLAPAEARRVRALLARHPRRLWEECGHWITLTDEWVSIASLTQGLTNATPTGTLYRRVLQETADFSFLGGRNPDSPPLSELPPLSARLEERLHSAHSDNTHLRDSEWLRNLGKQLARAEFGDEAETDRVRELALALAETDWRESHSMIEVIPYLDGTPAGSLSQCDVYWKGTELLTTKMTNGRLVHRLSARIASVFGRRDSDIQAALTYCFERSERDIREYIEENFTLTDKPVPAAADRHADDTPEASAANPASVRGKSAQTHESPQLETNGNPPINGELLDARDGAREGEVTPTTHTQLTDHTSSGTDNEASGHRRTQRGSALPRPSLMERFAVAEGFHPDGPDGFRNTIGESITKVHKAPFPWQRRSPDGSLVRSYWAKDSCIDDQPLLLDADVWHLLIKCPDSYALILSRRDGSPEERTGAHLTAMRESGQITLFPAAYRLVRVSASVERPRSALRPGEVENSGTVHASTTA